MISNTRQSSRTRRGKRRMANPTASGNSAATSTQSSSLVSLHSQMHASIEQLTNRRSGISTEQYEQRTEQCEQRIVDSLHQSNQAVGTALIRLDSDQLISAMAGSIPRVLLEPIQKVCASSLAQRSGQLTVHKETRLAIFCSPVVGVSVPLSIVTLVPATDVTRAEIREHSAIATSYLQICHQHATSNESIRIASQMRELIDLTARLQQHETFRQACDELANSLKSEFGANFVAVTIPRHNRIRIVSMAGVSQVDKNSAVCRVIGEACAEAACHEKQVAFPAAQNDPQHAIVSHQSVAKRLACKHVVTQTLRDDDKVIAHVIWGENSDDIVVQRHRAFAAAFAAPATQALQLVRRSEKTWLYRALALPVSWTARFWRLLVMILVVAGIAAMWIPAPYKIRGQCVVDAVSHRFAVAPYDGIVERGFFHPGDVVQQGDLLATMDDKELRWELAGVVADIQRTKKERSVALKSGDVPATVMADLESERLENQKRLLEYRRENLEIRSSVQGFVLSGDLDMAENAAVRTGDTLYEVGPITPLKIQVFIPAEDVLEVQKDQVVKVWLDGVSAEAIELPVERVLPRSQTEDGSNVFVAEAIVQNEDQRLRPGMRGIAKVTGKEHPIGWNLFHKPWEYLQSRLSCW